VDYQTVAAFVLIATWCCFSLRTTRPNPRAEASRQAAAGAPRVCTFCAEGVAN